MSQFHLHHKWINPEQSGPVIVFLHEGLGSIEQWKDFPQELCNKLNLPGFLYDRQGHGKSDALTAERDETYLEKYALEELPRVVNQHLKNRDLILFGHSDGGTIALIYASKFPDRIKAIVTEAAHIYVEPITWIGIKPVIEEFETKGKLYHALKKYHGNKTEQTFYAWANTWKKKDEKKWNVSHYLNHVTAPLLAIQGMQDQYATEQHLFDITNLVSGSSKDIFLDNCRHSPHLEQRDEVVKIVVEYVNFIVSNTPV